MAHKASGTVMLKMKPKGNCYTTEFSDSKMQMTKNIKKAAQLIPGSQRGQCHYRNEYTRTQTLNIK